MSKTYGYKKYLAAVERAAKNYPELKNLDKTTLAKFVFDLLRKESLRSLNYYGQDKHTSTK